MDTAVTFHDRVGHERLAAAVAPVDTVRLHELLESAVTLAAHAALGDLDVEVELTLAGDVEMTHLNFDHMGERGPTDVLAFPLHQWLIDAGHSHLADEDGVSPPGAMLLGDVVVDLDQAERQAREGGWGVAEEIILLAIHGTLHLLGHDHAETDDELVMRRLESSVLNSLHRRHHDVPWQPGSLFDRAGHAVSAGS
ncbi:MAG: rRNA maturation RNase YbeY [Candidatus Limnocylindria bacterium]